MGLRQLGRLMAQARGLYSAAAPAVECGAQQQLQQQAQSLGLVRQLQAMCSRQQHQLQCAASHTAWQQQQQLLRPVLHPPAPLFSSSSSTCWQQQCRGYKTAADHARARNKKGIVDGGLYLGAIVLGMIGFSYASVPLYRAFCQATGYGGTVSQTHNIEAKLKAREENPNLSQEERAKQREIRVWFTADVSDDMPWKFTPTQEYVTVHPGESVLAFFTAQNRSPHAITGVSTYNVVPDKAAYYFNKIQCFCFEEQRLRGGEEVDMPVFFYIDPELVDDFNCRNIHDITLSYTFFKVDEDEDATADESSGVKLHGPGLLPTGVAAPSIPAPAAAAAAVTHATAAAASGAG